MQASRLLSKQVAQAGSPHHNLLLIPVPFDAIIKPMSGYDYRVSLPAPPRPAPPIMPAGAPAFPWVNALLFAATFFTTMLAGAYLSHFDSDFFRFWIMFRYHPEWLIQGLAFSVPLLAILLAHEMGHYLVSKYHGVHSSLPYFIPGPSLVGTFGAVIFMKSRIPDRRALFDIGAAGPLAGLMVALFTLFAGMATAHTQTFSEADYPQGMVAFHPNLLLYAVMKVWSFTNSMVASPDVMIESPLLDAACVGFLVTALNLLPVGQLDGGHVAYAALGRRASWLTWFTIAALLGMAFLWPAWGIMVVFLVLLTGFKGLRHPPPDDPDLPLTPGRSLLAIAMLIIFILILAPVPVSVYGP